MTDSSTPTPAPDPSPVPATPAAPVAPARSAGPRIGWLTLVLALVATLVVGGFGGAAIASGVASAQTRTGFSGPGGQGMGQGEGFPGRQNGGTQNGGTGQTGGTQTGGGMQGGPGGFTAGEITKVDGATITVRTRSGDTVTVTTTDDTTVTKAEKGSVSDLKKGETITVRGATANGKVTATQITEGTLGGPGRN